MTRADTWKVSARDQSSLKGNTQFVCLIPLAFVTNKLKTFKDTIFVGGIFIHNSPLEQYLDQIVNSAPFIHPWCQKSCTRCQIKRPNKSWLICQTGGEPIKSVHLISRHRLHFDHQHQCHHERLDPDGTQLRIGGSPPIGRDQLFAPLMGLSRAVTSKILSKL